MENLCPCCSGKIYEECCAPFHQGLFPKRAVQLMRSRYSAYALDKADYIIATTHPKNSHYVNNKVDWKCQISQFSHRSTFLKLEIHDFTEGTSSAKVSFTAYIRQGSHDATFSEISSFEKIGGRWLYKDGIVTPNTKTS